MKLYEKYNFVVEARQRDLVEYPIGGNKYRLVVAICFRTGYVLVKFIGTHAQYDKIDVQPVEIGDPA